MLATFLAAWPCALATRYG